MEQLERPPAPGTGYGRTRLRLRSTAGWAAFLLGVLPSAAWIVADLLPQTGPISWGTEVVALGATPSLLAVLDASVTDWRAGGGSLSVLVRHLLALALALLGVAGAVSISTPDILYSTGANTGTLLWLLLLPFATVTCAAFVTGRHGAERPGSNPVHGILAWVGFCLPLAVVFTIDLFSPYGHAGLFAAVFFIIYGMLLVGMVVAALLVAPLLGLLGGWLRHSSGHAAASSARPS